MWTCHVDNLILQTLFVGVTTYMQYSDDISIRLFVKRRIGMSVWRRGLQTSRTNTRGHTRVPGSELLWRHHPVVSRSSWRLPPGWSPQPSLPVTRREQRFVTHTLSVTVTMVTHCWKYGCAGHAGWIVQPLDMETRCKGKTWKTRKEKRV